MTILFFLVGLFVGSFLNVLIDRIPRNEKFIVNRSHCDFCMKTLKWFDMLPVFSFLLLQGKCRYCSKFIGWKYPLVELTTACLYALVYFLSPLHSGMNFPTSSLLLPLLHVLFQLYVISTLIVVFYADLFTGIIPDKIIIPAMAVSFLSVVLFSFYLLPWYLLTAFGLFFFFFLLFALTNGRGMGFGDVKFAFLMGLLLGWPIGFLAVYIAFITGAAVALLLIFLRKKKFTGGTMPFGPFLVLGTVLCLLWGNFLLTHIILRFL